MGRTEKIRTLRYESQIDKHMANIIHKMYNLGKKTPKTYNVHNKL